MAKIMGNTTTTPITKVSLLKNDVGYVTEQYVEDVVIGNIGQAVEEIIKLQEGFIEKSKVTMYFLDSNKVLLPVKLEAGITWAEAIDTEELKAINQGFQVGDDGYVRCWLSSFIKEADYEGYVSVSTFPTWCIKGTDLVKDGQVYTSSGIYEYEIYG